METSESVESVPRQETTAQESNTNTNNTQESTEETKSQLISAFADVTKVSSSQVTFFSTSNRVPKWFLYLG